MSTKAAIHTIGFATTGRADFGCLLPLIRAAKEDPAFEISVCATGTHFSEHHGNSVDDIIAEGFEKQLVRLPCEIAGDRPQDLTDETGDILRIFGREFATRQPDLLIVLGDRYDLLPIVAAAIPFNIPIAHLSGGEETTGAIDNVIRHALSKLAHLHYVSHQGYAERLIGMGEEPWRITVSGEPGLDFLRGFAFDSKTAVYEELGLDPARAVTVFTFHPETRRLGTNQAAIETILEAADGIDSQIVFTYPGADADAAVVREAVERYCTTRDDCHGHAHLGSRRYFNLLRHADCMVGNSSSGVIESPSFGIPVVDIGQRQNGRIAAANVIRVPVEREALTAAWRKALSPEFRASVAGLENPYGDGHASQRILDHLKTVELNAELVTKSYSQLGRKQAA